ncbi:MAG: GtrA family protein [Bacteroidales bacterium]|nr:GtrA family protein [Bacteroidales bacterium]
MELARTMPQISHRTVIQFVKYALVGVLNTLVTLLVIFVCKSLLHVPLMGANAIGYGAGVINSFIWNKTWVFRSDKDFRREALKFLGGFALCYALQAAVVWTLSVPMDWADQLYSPLPGVVFSGYAVATILGNVVYTIANFIYNRAVTFK